MVKGASGMMIVSQVPNSFTSFSEALANKELNAID